jgi:DNA-binding transcriptional MerR regulator
MPGFQQKISEPPAFEDKRRSNSAPFYKIKDLAAEFGITRRTVQIYADKGLLQPSTFRARIFYTNDDRDRLRLILKGKKLRFTLAEIESLLTVNAERRPVLKFSLAILEKQIDIVEQQGREVDTALASLKEFAGLLAPFAATAETQPGSETNVGLKGASPPSSGRPAQMGRRQSAPGPSSSPSPRRASPVDMKETWPMPRFAALEVNWDRFGDDLQEARLKNGLSLRQLGAQVGVPAITLSRLETKKYTCRAETFLTLVAFIGSDAMSYTHRTTPARRISFSEWMRQK